MLPVFLYATTITKYVAQKGINNISCPGWTLLASFLDLFISISPFINPKRRAYLFEKIVIEAMGYIHRPELDDLSLIS